LGAELDAAGDQAILIGLHGVSVHALQGGPPLLLRGRTAPLAAAFGAGGAWIATANADGSATRWRRDGTGTRIGLGVPSGGLRSARFDASGALHVRAADDTIRVFRLAPRADGPSILQGHQGPVALLRFAPGGRYLASAGTVGAARVWDL